MSLKRFGLAAISFTCGFLLCAAIFTFRAPQYFPTVSGGAIPLLSAERAASVPVIRLPEAHHFQTRTFNIENNLAWSDSMFHELMFPGNTPRRSLHLLEDPSSFQIDLGAR